MNLESLEHFKNIAEIQSISRVAEKSHISQPALSHQIQKLEESVGQKLLLRSNKGVRLTPAGEIVLKYAENIIRTYEKMLSELEERQTGEIKIEADSTIATYCLPCALLRMKAIFPNHNYNLISGSSDEIEEDVVNDICEVGFITRPSKVEGLVNQNVIKEKVVLISPLHFNLAERVALREAIKHPLIILKEECIIKENLKMALEDSGYNVNQLNIIARLETTEAIKTLVQRGYGLAFVPYNAVKEEHFSQELQVSRLEGYNLDYDIFMINKTADKLNAETREFIEGFKKLGNNICY